MKIVQVNTICGVGSIGRICVDLYETLQKNGEEAYIATGRGSLPLGIKGYVIGNKADFVCHVMKNFTQGKAGFGSKQVTEKFLHWLSEVQPDLDISDTLIREPHSKKQYLRFYPCRRCSTLLLIFRENTFCQLSASKWNRKPSRFRFKF